MIKKYTLTVLLIIATLGGTFVACRQAGAIAADVLFTEQDDVTLGQQVVSQINADTKTYKIWKDGNAASVKAYLNNVVLTELLKSPAITKKGVYKYNIEVINDTILNAFALPGGPIYVYTGLLKYLNSESAIAGVLGHEIAHAEKRHAVQNMAAASSLSILLGIVLGNNPSELAQIAANLVSGTLLLANSRDMETESDVSSFAYLKGTKYYPGSVKFFFEQLKADGLVNSQGKVATLFSTHPEPIARISETDSRLRSAGLQIISYDYTGTDINLYRTEYNTNIKSKLP